MSDKVVDLPHAFTENRGEGPQSVVDIDDDLCHDAFLYSIERKFFDASMSTEDNV